MARRRNPAHRDALLTAATQVVAAQGLAAATTAAIAKEAGVSTGTLFVYFESKQALINELYLSLKGEMGRLASEEPPFDLPPREQLRRLWFRWVDWATDMPDKRRALAQLAVAEDITDESREASKHALSGASRILERCQAGGPLEEVPLEFALQILSAIADVTVDELIRRPSSVPASTDPRTQVAFDAIWRALAGCTRKEQP